MHGRGNPGEEARDTKVGEKTQVHRSARRALSIGDFEYYNSRVRCAKSKMAVPLAFDGNSYCGHPGLAVVAVMSE